MVITIRRIVFDYSLFLIVAPLLVVARSPQGSSKVALLLPGGVFPIAHGSLPGSLL